MMSVKKYLSDIGRKGGLSGRGASKRRDPEHYRKMVEARRKKKTTELREKS
jgi:general stress protein YciG